MTIWRRNREREQNTPPDRPGDTFCTFICEGAGAASFTLPEGSGRDWNVLALGEAGHCADGRVSFLCGSVPDAAAAASGAYIALVPHGCVPVSDALDRVRPYLADGAAAACGECSAPDGTALTGIFSRFDMYSGNCMRGVLFVKKSAAVAAGFPATLGEADMYAFALRLAGGDGRIVRVPEVLSRVPGTDMRTAAALRRAAEAAAPSDWKIMTGGYSGSFRVRPVAHGKTAVAVILPCSRGFEELRDCLSSLESDTLFENTEHIVAGIGVTEPRLIKYLDILEKTRAARVLRFAPDTAVADALNYCAAHSQADAYIFMDPSCRVLSPDWIDALLEATMMGRVGAVGARLTRADGAVVHAGIIVGLGGWFDSPFAGVSRLTGSAEWNWYVERMRQVSAVSARCMPVTADAFCAVGGFGADMDFGFDVDICLRLGRAGYDVVYTPFSKLRCPHLIRDDFPVREDELVKCYDSIRSVLISGDPYCGRLYDMRYPVLRALPERIPAIKHNPFNK